MQPTKQAYSTPELVVHGSVEKLTQGPLFINTNDNPTGQNDPINIGCQPSDFKGPDYKLCS